jgi:hypothetical protein
MTIMHPHHLLLLLLLLLLPPHSLNNAPTLARNNQLLSKNIFQSKDAYHSIPFATPPICPSVPIPCSLSNASRKQMTQETTYKLRLSPKITTKTQKHHRSQEFSPPLLARMIQKSTERPCPEVCFSIAIKARMIGEE